MEKNYVAGVDLGTSKIKCICIAQDGTKHFFSEPYTGPFAEDLYQTMINLFVQISSSIVLTSIESVGFSSQCGTYILYRKGEENRLYDWAGHGGEEFVSQIKNKFTPQECIDLISMPCPRLVSYPGPRALWFQSYRAAEWENAEKYLQPKDYLFYRLTGEWYADKYSWRGLANNDGTYHTAFLDAVGITASKLPELFDSFSAPAALSAQAAEHLGLKVGIPVVVGCNDYFASLMGMGVLEAGQNFDVTGTSEHIGTLLKSPVNDELLICSPYLHSYVYYGVTASSGSSMAWAMQNFGGAMTLSPDKYIKTTSPVFLPYINGERAPLWNSNATGGFFQLTGEHSTEELKYSVFEGVAFSIYHIWEQMQTHPDSEITVSGGASNDPFFNLLKASLLDRPYKVTETADASALGAAMCAALGGTGWFSTIGEAVSQWIKTEAFILPDKNLGELLRERFDVYKRLIDCLTPMWRSNG